MEKIYYVSPSGKSGNGTRQKPFSSPERALDHIRAQRRAGRLADTPIRIELDSGVYPLSSTLLIDGAVSGSENSPLVIASSQGATAVLEGGILLDYADFTPVSDQTVLSYVKSETARASLLQYDLRKCGIESAEQLEKSEFFCNGKRGVLARYPANDFLRVGEGVHNTDVIPDHTGVVATWHTVKGVRIRGYFPADYWCGEADVLQYDPENRTFRISTNEIASNNPFFFYNVLDEIANPGDYYIDTDGLLLYVYPSADFDSAELMLSSLNAPLVTLDGAHDVTFCGLTFEGSRQGAVDGTGDRITLDRCTVRDVFGLGIHICGYELNIRNSHIHDIGAAAINISGGDSAILRPGRSVVTNNHIHHYAQRSGTYNAAVNCSNFIEAGFEISHNCIHDSIHNGIMVASGDTFVEYNEIYNVCTEAADAGAIYFGRWEIQNLVFRYNYIHDVYNRYGFGSPHAIYNDDGGSGKVAYGNVLVHIAGDGFAFGGGNNNIMYNNIMVDCGRAAAYDSRQYYGGWEHDWAIFPNGNDWRFLYNNKSFLSRSWVARYARMTTIKYTRVEDRSDRLVAGAVGHAAYYGNVEVACRYPRAFEEPTMKFITCRDNMVYDTVEKAGFEDFAGGNFNFKQDSAVRRDMPFFADIPFDEIGTYEA